MKKFLLFAFLVAHCTNLFAQAPSGYYTAAQEKVKQELMASLHQIIKDHTVLSYSALWSAFYVTDDRIDGKVWDMYSSCSFTFGNDQDSGSGGTSECQFYNREHSFPKSWFNDESPMYTDIFHLYPTDKKVNSVRSNYPFGEVGTATYTSSNGCKLGNSSYAGYSGTVFEPIDEYKGDFARTYFYMATRYYDKIKNWSSPVTNGTQYPAYKEWVVNLLLEWHEQDPVSQKEIDRNNAIFDSYQHNRNPYIDHPEFALRVWGDATTASSTTYFNKSNIFPNPANRNLRVTVSEPGLYNISFVNQWGVCVKSERVTILGDYEELIVEELTKGMYIVRIEGKNITEVKRLIISR
ncbi:MAG: endonuclease [Tenuifilaceae bacterium]|jgi:endonuclease I|nr:endonuclease [Tenuifilaceae bacterium]